MVTGTEVLSGRVADRNGRWMSEQLLEMGVDVAHITICGDRPADLTAELAFLRGVGVDLIITSGGLGPTADDVTVATVAEFTGRPLHSDPALREDIAQIIAGWQRARGFGDGTQLSPATLAGIDKQSLVPEGATSIPPTGTAPGVAIAAQHSEDAAMPAILILPGPPRELQQMWPAALATREVGEVLSRHDDIEQSTIRMYGLPEADLAATLRAAESDVDGFGELEITTCLSRGEVEMVTRYPVRARPVYAELSAMIEKSHPRQVFSIDGSTIDDQLAELLRGHLVATAESCTGGLIAARLTERPGSSAYVAGGVVAYSNEVKIAALGVPAELIAEHGAVSEPVAAAMAQGALTRCGADVAVSTSGVAGPSGGTAQKPVGTVCFGVAVAGRDTYTRTLRFPGDRGDVRALATTAVLHMLERSLRR